MSKAKKEPSKNGTQKDRRKMMKKKMTITLALTACLVLAASLWRVSSAVFTSTGSGTATHIEVEPL